MGRHRHHGRQLAFNAIITTAGAVLLPTQALRALMTR
jgi:hypothetical protein